MKHFPAELRAANQSSYRIFLFHTVLYRGLLCALILCFTTLTARAAESLPAAPTPQRVSAPTDFTVVDYSLAAGLIAGRALDFASTSECLHNTLKNGCHEALLPDFIVKNKATFAAFEIGAASLEVFSMYELRKHGHPRLARTIGAVNVGLSLAVDLHNYSLATRSAQ